MTDHERIWLQSAADAKNSYEGRLWCEDKVWPEGEDQGEPTEYIRADLAESSLATLTARVAELEAALTPSGDTKAAYIGEFKFTFLAGLDEFGDDLTYENVTVPWTTVKEIMAAIRAYALDLQKDKNHG